MKSLLKRPHRERVPRKSSKSRDITKEDFEAGTCRTWNGDTFGGTGEMVVVFGPEMSAKEAVEALQLLVRRIKKERLLTGRDEYIFETVDGKLFV
jgi:hypothetical protein